VIAISDAGNLAAEGNILAESAQSRRGSPARLRPIDTGVARVIAMKIIFVKEAGPGDSYFRAQSFARRCFIETDIATVQFRCAPRALNRLQYSTFFNFTNQFGY
jgi:hypothetical protein